MKPFSSLLAFLASSTLLFVANAGASPLDDFYIEQAIGRYYSVPTDVRSMGSAGAASPLCSGAGCLLNNPAGLGWMRSNELYGDAGWSVLKGRDLLGDHLVEQESVSGAGSLAIPLGLGDEGAQYGVVAVGYSRYQGRTTDALSIVPDGHRRSLGYGYALSQHTSLGYMLTFYDDQLNTKLSDIHSHSRFLHVFGLQQKLAPDLDLGVVFKLGIGQSDTEDYRLESDGLSRPREYGLKVALGYDLDGATVFASAAGSVLHSRANLDRVSQGVFIGGDEEGEEYVAATGVEVPVAESVVFRTGVRYRYVTYEFERRDVQDLTGYVSDMGASAGLGVELPALCDGIPNPRIDYGFDLGTTSRNRMEHRVALTLPF